MAKGAGKAEAFEEASAAGPLGPSDALFGDLPRLPTATAWQEGIYVRGFGVKPGVLLLTKYSGSGLLNGNLKKAGVLVCLLVVVAVGPSLAFAGVSVVYPASTKTADVDETPPITFSAGTDHSTASSVGFAGTFSAEDNSGAYTLTVFGLSDGKVTVDDLVNVSVDASVATHKMNVDTALGTGISPDVMKIRLWTGSTAPSADGDTQVCAVLDLTAAAGTESTNACSTSTKMQLIYDLPAGQTTESDTVKIAPSSISFS